MEVSGFAPSETGEKKRERKQKNKENLRNLQVDEPKLSEKYTLKLMRQHQEDERKGGDMRKLRGQRALKKISLNK